MTAGGAPGSEPAPGLVLYGRVYCHLCDDMLRALAQLRPEFDFELESVDIEDIEPLEQRYGERVPVLCTAAGEELCALRLDADRVRAYLSGRRFSLL